MTLSTHQQLDQQLDQKQLDSLRHAIERITAPEKPGLNLQWHFYLSAIACALPLLMYFLLLLFLVAKFFGCIFVLISSDLSGLAWLGTLSLAIFLCALAALMAWPLSLIKDRSLPGLQLDRQQQSELFELCDSLAAKLDAPKIENIALVSDNFVDVGYASWKDFYHRLVSLSVGMAFFRAVNAADLLALVFRALTRIQFQELRWPYFIIVFCRAWCYRVLHHDLHKKLDAESPFARGLAPVFSLLQFMQKVFEVMHSLLVLLSQAVLEKNELRADDLQRRFFGDQEFSALLQRLVLLDQSWYAALEQIGDQASVQRNHFDLITKIFSSLQPNQAKPIEARLIDMAQSEHFNSWHFLPPLQTRLTRSIKLKTERNSGLSEPIKSPLPARALLHDAHELESALSEMFYHICKPDTLVEQDKIPDSVSRQQTLDTKDSLKILKKFTSGLFRPEIVWDIPDVNRFRTLSDAKLIAFLNKVVVSIRHSLPELNRFMANLEEFQKQLRLYHFYQWLYKDGSRNRPSADVVDKVKFNIKEYEEKFNKNYLSYRQSYGMRVAVAVFLGRDKQSFSRAQTLLKILLRLGALEADLREAAIKASTLGQLMARRDEGDNVHQKTIVRLGKMLLKTVDDLEQLLSTLPVGLMSDQADFDVMRGKINKDELLDGGDYEGRVLERYLELRRYYELVNVVASAKIAQFVAMIERTQGIESVVKVELSTAGRQ